ncbi:ATP-dependent RecD-like DNA helicase [Anaerobacillus sp. CMMVII]|uniref:SF1B family DNA helicase RecD2 n=1 Tax=Anaerobacillus sp. CMMVII TaxID=2755588 RepID=UPI0021B823AE|nr:ATP-dependent RecD-like DNA helicase [Anaerobacillus sp. CMMVII]MCT8139561.1 ATP-dependent RecD-like DNA helicase [Anaerobacillus sp. CMMVII]
MIIETPNENQPYIKGELITVVYMNEENFYTVARVKVHDTNVELSDKVIAIVGTLPKLDEEHLYTFYGKKIDHPKFGEQFQVSSFEKEIPKTTEGIVRYLSSDRFKGIGRKTAEAIVQTLGEQAISKIIEDKNVLKKIPTLKDDKIQLIYNQVIEHQGIEQVLIELYKFGFGAQLAMRIFQAYKDETLQVVKTNPYQLIYDVEGIGFARADALGQVLGFTKEQPERIHAGCLHIVQEMSLQEGHVYIERSELIGGAIKLLSDFSYSISRQDVEQQLLFLEEEGQLIVEGENVYLPSLFFAEKGLVTNISKLLTDDTQIEEFPEAEFLKAIGETEEELKIEYAPSQKEAIKTALKSGIMILTGGPGTGKTTVIKGIVESYAKLHGLSLNKRDYGKNNPFPIILVAPTGRAAKRMSEATGLPAETIHRLLGWKGGHSGFEKDEDNPIEGKLLIVDEVSMVDIWLANQLFKSLPSTIQVILVGDEDQLPSVGPGQVLSELLHSNVIPTVNLIDIYRQAKESSIIQLAHKMKEGHLPEDITEAKVDRRFFPCSQEQVISVITQICQNALKKGYTAKEIQVLAPMYRGNAGIEALNTTLQKIFNPKQEKQREIVFGEVSYRVGDVVLQLVNNPEENVFNGDRGEIVAIFYAKENVEKQDQVVISFEGIEVTYTKQDLNQITLAYCCSVHKSQGSEFPIVIMPIVRGYHRMLRRNLVYTGITRAKEYLILCGEVKAFETAIQQQNEMKRNTKLREKLMAVMSLSEEF